MTKALASSALAALALSWTGCQPFGSADGDTGRAGANQSERGGLGLGSTTQAVVSPSQVIDARRSVAVTDTAVLRQFSLPAVLNQLATQNGNPGFTGTLLFRQLWETQNTAATSGDLQPSAHCTDNGTTLNGFPNVCRPQEGAQANAANATNINSYAAIGLFNRFDLAPTDGSNCGEYRIVFGKTSGGGGRSFMIFEAILPNPRPELGLEGCRPVQVFWRDLSNTADINLRANALKDFYFTGLPGFSPVFAFENYGFNAAGAGQIRVNMFIQAIWDLKEFKLERQCQDDLCTLKAIPATVKVNPFGDLFNPASPNALAGEFQTHFVSQVPILALADINRFNYDVPDKFNTGHSDAQSGGAEDDYVANFGTSANAFRTAIQDKLTSIGSALTPTQIVARAQALSCAGCHQRSNNAAIGGGFTFPSSAGFVQNTEFTENGPDGTRFQLSNALTGTFLPFRKGVIEEFLSAPHPVTAISQFDIVASAADANNVYWVENRASGAIMQASLNSGGERALALDRANPTAIATDGINVYWIEAAGAIFAVPVGGGEITPIATELSGISGLATDGVDLYFTQNGDSIASIPVGGGALTTTIAGRTGVTGQLAVDGSSAYWQEGEEIQKAPKQGGEVTTLFASAAITGLATDGVDLYLAENVEPGNILKLPVDGGGVTNVFSGSLAITSVAVGASSFAWTSNTNPGQVMAKVKR